MLFRSQSVYAVITEDADSTDVAEQTPAEGAVVRFGCPFPSFPSVVTP